MKVVTYNINGIRASKKLGLFEWIKSYSADVYCFQEVRCKEKETKELLFETSTQMNLFGNAEAVDLSEYYPVYNCGEVAGYAGTLILSKFKPDKVMLGLNDYFCEKEGRTTTIIIGDTAIVDAYIPNGNSRLDFKMQYLEALNHYLSDLLKQYKVICVGDFNIAHTEIDLTNPKECKTKSVFLPVERDAFSSLLNLGFIDTFRFLNPEKIEYSWRSYRSRIDNSYQSWKYRIDYVLASNNLDKVLKSCDILDLPYSDHLAVVCDFDNK